MTPPSVIADYFAAKNRRDVAAMFCAFATSATVKDENVVYEGSSQIRRWLDDITAKHRLTFEIVDVRTDDRGAVATVRANGDVPGSPFRVRYAFTLSGATIARLEIDLEHRKRRK